MEKVINNLSFYPDKSFILPIAECLKENPEFFELLDKTRNYLDASLFTSSPAPFLEALKILNNIKELDKLKIHIPNPGETSKAKELIKEISKILDYKFIFRELFIRIGGKKAFDKRVGKEAIKILSDFINNGIAAPKAIIKGGKVIFYEEGVKFDSFNFEIKSKSISRFYSFPALQNEDDEYEMLNKIDPHKKEWPKFGCIFVATIGEKPEKIAKGLFKNGDPFAGTIADAIASALVEMLSRSVVVEAEKTGILGPKEEKMVPRRYHIGYGDWDLKNQEKLFEELKPERIGVILTESMLMVPEKSVSGFIAKKRKVQTTP